MNQYLTDWLAALRSGKYEQCTGGRLRLDFDGKTEHCCLGVACEISSDIGVFVDDGNLKNFKIQLSDDKVFWAGTAMPPAIVMERMGLPVQMLSENNDVLVSSQYLPDWYPNHYDIENQPYYNLYITSLNDQGLLSFSDIAYLIEKTYLGIKETESFVTGGTDIEEER